MENDSPRRTREDDLLGFTVETDLDTQLLRVRRGGIWFERQFTNLAEVVVFINERLVEN